MTTNRRPAHAHAAQATSAGRPTARPPIAASDSWRQVIDAAGGRCECTGACRRSHAKSGGRCPHELPAHRLYAADPTVPAEQAWRTPRTQLTAWCAACLDAARRGNTGRTTSTGERPHDDQVPGPGGLLDLPEMTR